VQVEVFGLRYLPGYADILADPEDFPEELVGIDVLFTEVVEEVVNDLFFAGVKNLSNDTFIVVSDDLSFEMRVTMLVRVKE
jgi:hypothetical protein